MSFGDTYRIIALAPEAVEPLFTAKLDQYGEDLQDGNRVVRTICAHIDNTEGTRIRAADFPTTVTATPLTDGRVAFRLLWQSDLMAEFDANGLPGVEELTEEQFLELLAQNE